MTLPFPIDTLYTRDGLIELDTLFLHHLHERDPELTATLKAARAHPEQLEAKEESDLLLTLAPHTEDFIAGTFGIENELQALASAHERLTPLYKCKRNFVQRRVAKKASPDMEENTPPTIPSCEKHL